MIIDNKIGLYQTGDKINVTITASRGTYPIDLFINPQSSAGIKNVT